MFNLRVLESWDARISQRILERLAVIELSMQELMGEHGGFSGDPSGMRPTLGGDVFRLAFGLALERHGLRLQETRNSQSQFVPDVFHFRLPDSFHNPVFRPEHIRHVVFDRDVFLRVRDEDLGRVRGQPIRPVLSAPDSLVPVFGGVTAWSVWDRRRFCCRKKAQQPQKVPSFEPLAPFRGS